MAQESCTIDGFGPVPVVRPASVADLGDAVRGAAARNEAVYPLGGRTQLDLGNPPTKPGVAVDLRGLDQVIDFPARDMTITVQAGVTIAKLQALLAPENLQLPIDVPDPERATLGGIIATNTSGPRRYGYGTLRDYVIGISAVNDEGNEFKAGGRVVKNVAGYDLCKLLVGSLGTLGIVTQVTLKLRPLPEETALVTFGSNVEELESLLDRIHDSRTRPVCLELLNQGAGRNIFDWAKSSCSDHPWVVVVGYEGNADAVNWQVQQLVKELGSGRSLDARIGASAESLWQALVEWPMALEKWPRLKWSFPSSLTGALSKLPFSAIRIHAGNGIGELALDDSSLTENWEGDPHSPAEGLRNVTQALRTLFESCRASVIVTRCPSDWKSSVSVWGRAPAELGLMQAVKRQFDPQGLFNPGRFVGGI